LPRRTAFSARAWRSWEKRLASLRCFETLDGGQISGPVARGTRPHSGKPSVIADYRYPGEWVGLHQQRPVRGNSLSSFQQTPRKKVLGAMYSAAMYPESWWQPLLFACRRQKVGDRRSSSRGKCLSFGFSTPRLVFRRWKSPKVR